MASEVFPADSDRFQVDNLTHTENESSSGNGEDTLEMGSVRLECPFW